MTSKQLLFLAGLLAITGGVVWWVSHQSTAPQNYRWFVENIPLQRATNQRLIQRNQYLRRKSMALRYDHRTIAREIRDQLSLSKKGELIIYLPRN